MNRQPVESSNLASVGYQPSTRMLEVEFMRGGVYRYSDVPQDVFDELIAAPSPGSYFAVHIKNTYPCQKADA
jgi:hypothetical protein